MVAILDGCAVQESLLTTLSRNFSHGINNIGK